MYLVVFFLLLWTLFQHIFCENCTIESPDPYKLYILSSPGGLNDSLRETFMDYFSPDEIAIETNCSGQLQDALRLTTNLRYVVYFGITDFYKNNYNDVRYTNMKWAGNYGEINTTEVCKSNVNKSKPNSSPIREIREGRADETCSYQTHETLQYTTLISKYIDSEKAFAILYKLNIIHRNEQNNTYTNKIITTYDERPKKTNFIILSCTNIVSADDEIIFKDKFKTVRHIRYVDTYKYATPYWNNVIAIVAPSQEYVNALDYYADKPIIFYDEITNPTMIDMYKNAITRETELKDEVRTLVEIISYRWKRVAILSDGSAESGAFENEVRTLFELKEISYTVRSIEEQKSDFNEALSYLKSVDARIIIANVDQNYADSLVEQAQKNGMINAQKIIWIARAWSNVTCLRAAKGLGTLLTVTLKKSNPDNVITVIKKLFEENYEYSGFLTEAKFAQDIRENYRDFKQNYRGNFQVVKTLSNGQQFIGIEAVVDMPNDSGECTLRSNNFDKPCDDMVGIMIALVIVVLAVTVLGITYFFDEPHTPYNRMPH